MRLAGVLTVRDLSAVSPGRGYAVSCYLPCVFLKPTYKPGLQALCAQVSFPWSAGSNHAGADYQTFRKFASQLLNH